MKIGQFKKFNKYCGIAKIKLEKEGELYVIYGDYMSNKYELGKPIGKGLTKEEAMIDAIKNYNKFFRSIDKKIEKYKDLISKICAASIIEEAFVKPIIPIQCEYSEEIVNPNVIIGEDGNVALAVL